MFNRIIMSFLPKGMKLRFIENNAQFVGVKNLVCPDTEIYFMYGTFIEVIIEGSEVKKFKTHSSLSDFHHNTWSEFNQMFINAVPEKIAS